MNSQFRLIDGLKRTLCAGGSTLTIRETHISWVLLAEDRAWKIKKAVNFGFLDFSTLAKRKHACNEELRLNRRFAPGLYLAVVPICGTVDQPVLNGQTAAIEYAVCMRRFDESGLLSQLAELHLLEAKHVDAIAIKVAQIHRLAPVAERESEWGEPERVHHWLSETLVHIKGLVDTPATVQQIKSIDQLSIELYEQLKALLKLRNESGFIRECHGDLHLRNMVWIDEKLVPFDCIEFNPGLRWIDVISEAAFVMMDLQDRGYPGFAWRFINHYLTITGDYIGLELLRYYTVYRALVRAKVVLLQKDEPETPKVLKIDLSKQYIAYANLAERWLAQYRRALIVMHGVSASGKSTVAASLAERYGCIHLRSDVERKRLHRLPATESTHAKVGTGIYSSSASDKTYQRLADLAETILDAGYPVIVDAAFLERSRRACFQQLAIGKGIPFVIMHCEAERSILEQRIVNRAQQGHDPSEATLAVLDRQIEQQERLTEDEYAITVKGTEVPALPAAILNSLCMD